MTGAIAGLIGSLNAVVVSTFTSLVPNGDFEQGALPAGWSFASASSGISSTQSHSASKSLQVRGDYSSESSFSEYTGAILAGAAAYSISVWLYSPNLGGYQYQWSYQLTIGASIYTGYFVSTTGGAAGWSQLSVSNLPRTTSNQFTLYIAESNFNDYFIDDIALADGPTAP